VADEKATFAIELEDETSGSALAAAKSLETLRGKIEADTKSLRALQKGMRAMRNAGLKGSDTFKKLAAQSDALKSKIGLNTQKFVELGGSFDKIEPKARTLGGALTEVGAPLGGLAAGAAKFGAVLSSPIAGVVALTAGAIALVVAMVSLVSAVANAAVALGKFSLASSDARRSEALQIEGANTLTAAYGRLTATAGDYQAAIDRASDSTNVGRDTLRGYTQQLARAGLRGESLTAAVEAMGLAATVQGERGARRFLQLANATRAADGSVQGLVDRYRSELGPIARRVMLSLDNQSSRLSRNLERLFSGIRTEPMLEALDSVGSLLSQSTASGRALKTLFEKLFQPIVDQVGEATPIIEAFFKGMVIGALIAGIGILRLKNKLDDLFPGFIGDANAAKIATYAGIAALGIFVGVLVLAAGAALLLAFAMFLVLLPFIAFIALVVLISAAIIELIDGIGEAFESIGSFVGDMVDGIVNAITGETPRVEAAFGKLGDDAAKGFAGALGIASPSKVFAAYGKNIIEGTINGIESGGAALGDATSSLVDEPAGVGLGGSTSISIGDITVVVGDEASGRDIALSIRDELASVLEGVNIEFGEPVT